MKLLTEVDMNEAERQKLVIQAIINELHTSTLKYGCFKSTHEAYGVLKEEVDEMWDACKCNNIVEMEEEAIQVAAMAIRFIIDARRSKGL